MKKIHLILLPIFLAICHSGFAEDNVDDEPVCHSCKVIREYNKTHRETDFIYYEDYLKDKQEKEQVKQNGIQQKSQDVGQP